MADKIDRSVEPKLGADGKKKDDKKSKELSPGVRVRARGKNDTQTKKKASASSNKVGAKAAQEKVELQIRRCRF